MSKHHPVTWLLGLALLAGCTSQTIRPGAPPTRSLETYLNIGSTHRDQVIDALGRPSLQLEQQRVLTWRIHRSRDGDRVAPSRNWTYATHSLVLVFDARGRLEAWRLIEVKA